MKKILLALAFVLIVPTAVMATEATTTTIIPDPSRIVINNCIGKGWTCRPALSLPVFDYSFRSGDFRARVMPQGGYGIASPRGLFSVDLFSGFIVGNGSTKNALDVSVIFSFLKYISVGTALEFRQGNKPDCDLLVGASLPLSLN